MIASLSFVATALSPHCNKVSNAIIFIIPIGKKGGGVQRFQIFLLGFALSLSPSMAFDDIMYDSVNKPGLKLEIIEGDYELSLEKGDDITDIQLGHVTIDGNIIRFKPEYSETGDTVPSTAVIVDDCTLQWKRYGLFRAETCAPNQTSSVPASSPSSNYSASKQGIYEKSGHFERFPTRWQKVMLKGVEISVPMGTHVSEKGRKIILRGESATAEFLPVKKKKRLLYTLEKSCHPSEILKSGDGKSYFMLCAKGRSPAYVDVVFKKNGKKLIAGIVKAENPAALKAFSIALASIKPVGTQRKHKCAEALQTRPWRPQDGSFTLPLPDGWEASGGTADLGNNGYIRIVRALSAKKDAAFIGVYYPFYQYMQMGYYGSSGFAPMEPEDYIRSRFFDDLARKYQISFNNLQIDKIKENEKVSTLLTRLNQQMYARYGLAASPSIRYIDGYATFLYEGKPYEMIITGSLTYRTAPLQGVGTQYSWGPSPIYLEIAKKGDLCHYYKTFEKMMAGWQVDMNWLQRHLQFARVEQREILSHYRKMSEIIHENSEARMSEAMREWEANTNVEMETFWDNYFALGGEERYNDPNTGEEIDLPTGADKYFYDRYSQSWVGVSDSNPDRDEIIQNLKEHGFIKLKPHSY